MHIPHSSLVVLVRKSADGSTVPGPRGVRTVQVDISDSKDLCGNVELAGIPNVCGILHLAGALDDGLVSNLTQVTVMPDYIIMTDMLS